MEAEIILQNVGRVDVILSLFSSLYGNGTLTQGVDKEGEEYALNNTRAGGAPQDTGDGDEVAIIAVAHHDEQTIGVGARIAAMEGMGV